MTRLLNRSIFGIIIIFFCLSGDGYAQIHGQAMWTWMGGTPSATIVYGTKGVPAPENNPGPRANYVTWIDTADNIYVFGGVLRNGGTITGYLSDLWKFDVVLSQWVYLAGESGALMPDTGRYGTLGSAHPDNRPGGRYTAGAWSDKKGNLWLFGGWGYDKNGGLGPLNDVWKFDLSTNLWTWVKGSDLQNQPSVYGTRGVPHDGNTPGCRQDFAWFDNGDGEYWLFGGTGRVATTSGSPGRLNDLWRFNTNTLQWTWVSGDNSLTTVANPSIRRGDYQVLTAAVKPPRRMGAAGMIDADSNIWIFGGFGERSTVTTTHANTNDVWKYDVKNDVWGWMAGDSTPANSYPGRFGVRGVYDPENRPGARRSSVSGGREFVAGWDRTRRYMIIYGGYGGGYTSSGGEANQGSNVVWQFNTLNNQFAWISGDTTGSPTERLGELRVQSPTNNPGSKSYTQLLTGKHGNLWLFGGRTAGATSVHSSIWMLDGCTAAPIAPAGIISGADTLCEGAPEEVYAVAAQENVYRYHWTLPAGWTGSSNVNSIGVRTDAASGTISVSSVNSCGQSQPVTYSVYVPPLPVAPGSITGNTTLCPGTSELYEITPVAGATSYTWALPQGWSGNSTGTSIQAGVGSSGTGGVTVRANNHCGSSTEQVLAVTVRNPVPVPGSIQGRDTLCIESGTVLRITPVSGAVSYEWLVPAGWQGSSTADTIWIQTGSAAGVYPVQVSAIGVCDTSAPQSLDVTVVLPPVASVTYTKPNLMAGNAPGYRFQWFLDGASLPASTGIMHRAEKNGYYHVLVTDEHGCTDTAGLRVTDIVEEEEPNSVRSLNRNDEAFALYPNPAKDWVYVQSPSGSPVAVQVLNMDGKLIAAYESIIRFDVGGLPEGVYFIRMQDTSGREMGMKKLVKVL